MHKLLLLAAVITLAGLACGPTRVENPSQLPQQEHDALTISTNAAVTQTDISGMLNIVGAGFAPNFGGQVNASFGLSSNGSGLHFDSALQFAPPTGCTVTADLLLGKFNFNNDCTLPSGRHFHGSISYVFGPNSCSSFGLRTAVDFALEPGPGQVGEVQVKGDLSLSFQQERLWVSAGLDFGMVGAQHSIGSVSNLCHVLDLKEKVFACNGGFNRSIDGQVTRLVAINDVQQSMCELLPYTGEFMVGRNGHIVDVKFSRPESTKSRVDVNGANGAFQLDLQMPVIGLHALCSAPQQPLAFDYATCGGCRALPMPPGPGGLPPAMGGTGSSGGVVPTDSSPTASSTSGEFPEIN
jgi:hypothetical protein